MIIESIAALELRRKVLAINSTTGLPTKQDEMSLVMEASEVFTSFIIRCMIPEWVSGALNAT